jgi:drug/metabolite transporter (DMT)-like permease
VTQGAPEADRPRPGPAVLNDLLLLLTAGIWGFAFVAQRAGMEHLGPLAFNALRFALGALTLAPVIALRRRAFALPSPAAAGGQLGLYGLAAGAVLFAGASLQQAGLVTTTAGKAGFITGLYVVLVPLFGLFGGQRAGALRWIAVGLAVAGLYLLSVSERLTTGRGDLLVLAGAFFWAAHVQLISRWSGRVDPIELAALQFAVCAAASGALSLLLERTSPQGIAGALAPLLYGGFLSVAVAFTLQVVAQKRAHPTHAAILLSLEGAFAALGGALLLGERLAAREAAGCGLLLAGMLASQLSPSPAPLAARKRPGPPPADGR